MRNGVMVGNFLVARSVNTDAMAATLEFVHDDSWVPECNPNSHAGKPAAHVHVHVRHVTRILVRLTRPAPRRRTREPRTGGTDS